MREKKVKNLLRNREGTAEVIGTIMFIMILLFFFTNVYLWHDAATKDMNQLYVEKMNAGMSISFDSSSNQVIINATSSEITLSMLWIDSDSANVHVYANLANVQVAPGDSNAVTITFEMEGAPMNSDGAVLWNPSSTTIQIANSLPPDPKFTIVNTLGVMVST